MLSEDSFQFAMENTKVILPPQRRLETFGNSAFKYYLVTEDMDQASLSRVREGEIQAERPQLLAPQYFARLLVDGFGEKGQAFADFISSKSDQFAFLKYGFQMKKSELRCYDVHEPIETVIGRVRDEVAAKQDPLAAVLSGVDDGWEVCLMKFMLDVVQASAPGNMRDLRQRGML